MRPDLRDDFLYLRGKIVDPTQPTSQQLQTDVRDVVLRAFDNATAKKLTAAPPSIGTRAPLIGSLAHEPSKTQLSVYAADGRIYVSRSSAVPRK